MITSRTTPLKDKGVQNSTNAWMHYFNVLDIVFAVPKGYYADLSEAQADLAGTVIHYQLGTPELINLTEQGLTSGELMSFENGTVYNSSDTFHSPNLSFDVVTDRNVQLDAKVDQTEFDAHKADYTAHSDLVLNNKITNGDFSDGTTGWSTLRLDTFTTLSNVATFIANSQFGAIRTASVTVGQIYYGRAIVKSTSNQVRLFIYAVGNESHSGSGNYETLSVRGECVESRVDSGFNIEDIRTSGFDEVYVKNNMLLDLTDIFGAGNEPTKEEMDTLIDLLGWFDGELTLTQKQLANWYLTMIRENRSAIIALGGSI
jgi:hypothetical protein